MTGKKGRKCSIRNCRSFQHTHKHLSFFRFPKDADRCKLWIDKSGRPDLAGKLSVHEDRVCEIHFEEPMFLNDYRNRLHQTAVPTLFLDGSEPPLLKNASRPVPKLKPMINNSIFSMKDDQQYKRQTINHSDDLLEEMMPPRQRRKMDYSNDVINLTSYRNSGIKMELNQNNLHILTQFQNQEQSLTLTPIRKSTSSSSSATTTTAKHFSNSLSNVMQSHMPCTITPMPMPMQIPSQTQITPSLPKNQSAVTITKHSTSTSVKSTPNQHHQQQQQQQKQFQQQLQQQIQPKHINVQQNTNNFKRPRQIFSIEQEEELANFVRDTSNYYNGMSSKDIRILAFVYGICNQVDLPNGWRETHQASFDWCLGFIKRNKLTSMMITNNCRGGSTNNNLLTSASDIPDVIDLILPTTTTTMANGDTKTTIATTATIVKPSIASEAC